MGPLLDNILDVQYTAESGDRQRRKAKRKEKFVDQVKKSVEMMQV